MPESDTLRPIERRMLRLSRSGLDEVEIAWRFRRSPRYVRQVLNLSRQPNREASGGDAGHAGGGGDGRTGDPLRPIERLLLRLRDEGADHAALAPRFRRSASFLARVEELARYKLARR